MSSSGVNPIIPMLNVAVAVAVFILVYYVFTPVIYSFDNIMIGLANLMLPNSQSTQLQSFLQSNYTTFGAAIIIALISFTVFMFLIPWSREPQSFAV